MSSSYAPASDSQLLPFAAPDLATPARRVWARFADAALKALDHVLDARPVPGLMGLASSCEALQPQLAQELRAAAARVSEG
jgi:hypothetical protein